MERDAIGPYIDALETERARLRLAVLESDARYAVLNEAIIAVADFAAKRASADILAMMTLPPGETP